MKRSATVFYLLVLSILLTSSLAIGQHFEPATDEGTSHSLLIQSVAVNDEDLVEDDEIGVFTPDGVCAGAMTISDDAPYGLTAFGDDPITDDIVEGFLNGEAFSFKLWDASAEQEYDANQEFGEGPRQWTLNDVTVITRLFFFGEPIPVIDIPTDEHDFGEMGVDYTAEWTLTISNIGFGNLTIENTSVDEQSFDTDFENEVTLEPDESFDLLVTFTPRSAQDFEGTLTITSNDPANEELTVSLSGTGTNNTVPEIVLSREEIDYEEWPVDLSETRIVTVSNEGTGDLTISDISANLDAYTTDWNGEDVVLAPRSNFDLTVTFAPEDEERYEGTLTITSDDPNDEEVTVALLGTGIEFEGHFWFARTAASHSLLMLSITLNGEPLVAGDEVAAITPDGVCAGAVVIEDPTTEDEEPVGFGAWQEYEDLDGFEIGDLIRYRLWDLSAEMEIDATPSYVSGSGRFAGNDGLSVSRLTAEAPEEPQINVYPNTIEYGQIAVEHSDEQFVHIRNIGGEILRVSNIESSDEDHFTVDFEIGFVIQPDEERYIGVTFAPAEAQEYEAELTIISNSPDRETTTVALTGEGIEAGAMISVSERSHDFGTLVIGEAAVWELIISNIGAENLSIDSVVLDNEVFTTNFPDEAQVLEPDQEITVEITFEPVDAEYYNGILTICNNDQDEDDATYEISLRGRGRYIPDIRVRPSSIIIRDVEIGNSVSRDITISNEGEDVLNIADIGIEGQYFTVDFDDAFTIDADDNYVFQVHFSPEEVGGYDAVLTIISDDPDEGTVEIEIRGYGIYINHPPEIPHPIEDIVLPEDFEPFIVADLDNIFFDPDEDELVFEASSSDPDNLIIELREGNQLYMESALNWFGTATVTIIADDQYEDDGRDLGPVRRLHSTGDAGMNPRRDDQTPMEFDVEVEEDNDDPIWDEVPDDIEETENTLIEFTLSGSDVDEDDLITTYASDDIPNAAEFTDNGDGSGSFSWRTNYMDAGQYTAVFTLSDGQAVDVAEVNITITDVNRAPVWVDGLPEIIEYNENDLIEVSFGGSDPDDDDLTVTYQSEDLPDDVEFTDNGDGTCSAVWQTTFDDAGVYHATFTLSDDEFNIDYNVVIRINNFNRTPVWDDIPDPQQVDEGATVEFNITGSDPDGDDLAITYNPGADPALPDDAFTDNGDGTGSFQWETSEGDDGEYIATFTLSDGDMEVDAEVIVTVGDVNQPPVWDEIPETIEGDENSTIEFSVRGSDPDENDLTIELVSDDLPEAAEFTDNENGTGDFSWGANYLDAGEYTVQFTISDGTFNIRRNVSITVININRSPAWEEVPETAEVNESELVEFTVTTSDPDEDDDLVITYISDDLPEDGVELEDHGDGTATFNWQTGYLDAGEYHVVFNVNDGTANVESDAVTITINDRNAPPEWVDVPEEIEYNEGQIINLIIIAEDVDEDELELTYRSFAIPDDASFSDQGDNTGTFVWETDARDDGRYTAIFTASDEEFDVEVSVTIIINDINQPPTWENPPNWVDIAENDRLELVLEGDDIDRDDLTIEYRSDDLPNAASFEDHGDGSCTLTWQPNYEEAGYYEASFNLSDGEYDVLTVVNIEVTNTNRAPEWDETPRDVEADEGDRIEFSMTGSDPDFEDVIINYSTQNIPGSAEFTDHGNGMADFSWQTSFEDAGEYIATFTMSDGDLSVEINVEIIVGNINHQPEWVDVPSAVHGDLGDIIGFAVMGEDVDGDDIEIIFSSDDLPEAVEFTDEGDGHGAFEWQTGDNDEGSYNATFTLLDGEYEVEAEVIITVGNVNQPPEWTDVPGSVQARETALLQFTVEGADPDDDDLTIRYASDDLPDNVDFTDHGDGTGSFSWQTGYDDAGGYTVVFFLSDGNYDIRTEVHITIGDVNRAPEWTSMRRSFGGDENTLVEFRVEGMDPDDDQLMIYFDSDDLPDDAHFTDRHDGIGIFSWQTNYDDAGDYTARFTLSDGYLEITGETTIHISNVNRTPVWDQSPDHMTVDEGDLVSFRVSGHDQDVENDLTITYETVGDNQAEGAEFTDYGDGIGVFNWQIPYDADGIYGTRFIISDGELEDGVFIRITVSDVNRTPHWVFVPEEITGDENEIITFNIAGNDPDEGDDLTLTYSSENLPDGVEFTDNGDATGTFFWHPGFENAGEYTANFVVTDGDFEITAEVPITVEDINRTPYWVDVPVIVNVDENEQFEFSVSGEDPDGDDLEISYRSNDIPDDAVEFTDNGNGTGALSGQPDFDAAGEYTAIFTLSDNDFDVDVEVTIVVHNVNRVPIFDEIPETAEADEDEWIAFGMVGSDPDGDEIIIEYSSDDLPFEVEFRYNEENNSGTFTWLPGYADAGEYTATFAVSDGTLETTVDVSVTVIHINLPPAWEDVPEEVEGIEDTQIVFRVVGGDPDEEDEDEMEITYSSDDLPDNVRFLDFGTGEGMFTWRPDFMEAGDYTATFTLTDGHESVETEVSITVANFNRPPVWDEDVPEEVTVSEAEWFELAVSASDLDESDELTIEFSSNLPPNAAEFVDNGDGSGDLTWQVTYEDAGIYTAVFIIDDGFEEVETEVTIIASDVNRPPIWTSTPDSPAEYDEGGLVNISVRGYDPDYDNLSIEFVGEDLPEAAEFTIQSPGFGRLVWQTTNEDEGIYNVSFTLSDGEYEDLAELEIVVGDVNRPPVFGNVPESISVYEEALLQFTVSGTDPDGDELRLIYTSENLPDDVEFTIEGNAGTLSWEPSYGDAGYYLAVFTLADDEYEITAEVAITVNDVNREPQWVSIPDVIETNENEYVTFDIAGADPDGDDLTMTYTSNDLPEDDVILSDRGDGTKRFSWLTNFNDAGSYTVTFILSDDEFEVPEDVFINVINVNRAPEWDDFPDNVEGDEDDLIEFTVAGSDPDGDDLAITYDGQNGMSVLPDAARFIDKLDGTGDFRWHPSYDDVGEYTALFTLSDRDIDVELEVAISIANTNQAPEWTEYPDNEQFTGYADEESYFYVTAVDPDNDDIEYNYLFLDGEIEDVELEVVDGVANFSMRPTRFEFGDYPVRFTANDGNETIRLDIEVTISNQHFRPEAETERQHAVNIESMYYFRDQRRDNPDELDEVAAITPAGIIAGTFQFSDDDPPWRMTLYGDDPLTHRVEGFRPGDEIGFIYWDHSAGNEIDVHSEIVSGDDVWQLNGFSVVELSVEPLLEADIETYDFGLVRVDSEVEFEVTFTSVGTATVEDLRLSIIGGGFSLDENGPLDLDPNDDITVTVTFLPDRARDYTATLHAESMVNEIDIELTGSGIEMGHFEYEITASNHKVDILDVTTGDEIGAFTPAGVCAGGIIIQGNNPWELYLWGDDPDTRQIEGFRDGERLEFRVWDRGDNEEIVMRAIYHSGPEVWVNEGSSIVALTADEKHFNWINTLSEHNLAITAAIDFFGQRLGANDEVAVVNPRGFVSGASRAAGQPQVIAFGDNPETDNFIEGFQEGEHIYFRIWKNDQEQEYFARPQWADGEATWTADGDNNLQLIVTEDNVAPIFRPVVVMNEETYSIVSGEEGTEFTFTVFATDGDDDPISLILSENDALEGAVFTDNGDGTGDFTWEPVNNQAGQHTAEFLAFDGWEWNELNIRILIDNVNNPPALHAEIEDQDVNEGDMLSIFFNAYDTDGDQLTILARDLPEGSLIDGQYFNWRTNYEQAGEYDITFRIIDNGQPPLHIDVDVNITVHEGNRPLAWQDIDPITAVEGAEVSFNVTATDPDGDDLELTAGNLPEGAEFTDNGEGAGNFTWETGYNDVGEYQPYFDADDGNETRRLTVDITIESGNRLPVFADIEDQVVIIGNTLDLSITADDPDVDDVANLVMMAGNLPPNATFSDLGEGNAQLAWRPEMEDRGVYPNVLFTVMDPSRGTDQAWVTFTARLEDEEGPVISDLFPSNRWIARGNQVTVSAVITDESSEVDLVEFVFDDQEVDADDFSYNEDSGEFSWSSGALEQGGHGFVIRAVDILANATTTTVGFIVNSSGGMLDIDIENLAPYTNLDMINLTGESEPFLTVQLWRGGEQLDEVISNRRGIFRFADIQLLARYNMFILRGYDEVDNEAMNDTVNVYLDLEAPEINVISPREYINDLTPQVQVEITDAGVGINEENGSFLALNGEYISGDDYIFFNEMLTYNIPDDLEEGYNFFSLMAVDLLGNAPVNPFDIAFFIDSQVPEVPHLFFDNEVDTIGNREPQINIAIADPLPSSGINGEEIVLVLDGQENQFVWDPVDGSVYFDYAANHFDMLDMGLHRISIDITDNAGNRTFAEGRFFISNVDDGDPPDFENQSPPDGAVVGAGGGFDLVRGNFDMLPYRLPADTISVVVSDLDAGVNWRTIWMRIIAGDDTTVIENEDLIIQMPQGRVMVPIDNDPQRGPQDMPGLEEGLNEVNVFGADEDGNEGEDEWEFFNDNSNPDPPVLNDPENEYVNNVELTVTGETGGDQPEYEEDYDNVGTVRIYRNGEPSVEEVEDYNAEFTISGVLLVEGQNIIRASVIDGGGNESGQSDRIMVFLDLSTPNITGLTAEGGRHVGDRTPLFNATLIDDGSGIDAENIVFTVDGEAVEGNYDGDNNLFTAEVQEELEDGDHTAELTVADMAGNERVRDYEFNVNSAPVEIPEFDLAAYTSVNRVYLTGVGEIETEVIVYLDDEEIGRVWLEDDADFAFTYTAGELPDRSNVTVMAANNYGTVSDMSDPQVLLVDQDAPEFSSMSPENSETVNSDLETITVEVNDALAGIDPDSYEVTVKGETPGFSAEDGSVTIDVSEMEFGDSETVEVIVTANDLANTPNTGRISWEFITAVNDPPVVEIADAEFSEDNFFTLNLHNLINDPDNAVGELEISGEITEGEDNATLNIDDEGVLHINPDDNWNGQLTIEVTAEDPAGLNASDEAVITVLAVNDPPVIEPLDVAGAVENEEFELQIEASDVDVDDELTFSDDTDLFEISDGGLISFTPTRDDRGMHTITIYVRDSEGVNDEETLTLIVSSGLNDPELIQEFEDQEFTEDDNERLITNFYNHFEDPDDDPLIFDAIPDPGWLIVRWNDDGDFFLRPMPDSSGIVEVTVSATDGLATIEDIFTVTVEAVNDPPEQIGGMPEEIVLPEDVDLSSIADLDSIFADVDNADLTFDHTGGEHLGVNIDEENILSLHPDENWFGTEVFTLLVSDNVNGDNRFGPERSSSDISLYDGSNWTPRRDDVAEYDIEVTILPVDDPPEVASPVEDQHLDEDSWPWTIADLDTVFVDPDGDPVTFSVQANDPLTTFISNENILTLTAPENYNGQDIQVTLTVEDDQGNELSDDFIVEVVPVNDPPEIIQPIDDRNVAEDTWPWVIIDLDDVFLDVDGDALVFDVEAPDPIDCIIDDENQLVLMVLGLDFNAADLEITVSADDGVGGIVETSIRSTRSLRSSRQVAGPVRHLRSTRVNNSHFGLGRTEIPVYQTFPGRDDLITESFVLTIFPINDAPYFMDYPEADTVNSGNTVEFTISASDVDIDNEGDALVLTMSDDGGTGAGFVDNGDNTGTFTWQTTAEDDGVFTPTFHVRDLIGADVEISIPLNILPIAVSVVDYPDAVPAAEGDTLVFTLQASDVDGDVLTLALEDDAGTGAEFVDNGDNTGTFTWLPDFEAAGDYNPVFLVSDPNNASVLHTVTISVENINRAPIIPAIGIMDQVFDEDLGPWQIADLDNIFQDLDGDVLTYAVSAPDPMLASVDANNVLTISAPENYHAADLSFIVTSSDAEAAMTDTFLVLISPINDAPTGFSLIDPRNRLILRNPWMIFKWEESVDVVEDSTITYSLVLFYDDTTHWFNDLTESELLVPRTSMMSDSSDTTQIEWWVWAYDEADSVQSTESFNFTVMPIAEGREEDVLLPTELTLGPVYPNPFNGIANIDFELPWEGLVEIAIYDLNGRKVTTLLNRELQIGTYSTYWDGMDGVGNLAASGIYLCRLKTKSSVRLIQVLLIR
ncbi:MAG: tandem-95 repeat protein [Candidatus Hatepunaea meridiana]|nr:tandem-95 repeat protein [Candidatus Hatepunaea meridiana]